MADKWIDAKAEQPPEFISVLGFFENFVPFPTVRECFRVPNGYDIPALSEIVPFDALDENAGAADKNKLCGG